jgi:hypothetical protein
MGGTDPAAITKSILTTADALGFRKLPARKGSPPAIDARRPSTTALVSDALEELHLGKVIMNYLSGVTHGTLYALLQVVETAEIVNDGRGPTLAPIVLSSESYRTLLLLVGSAYQAAVDGQFAYFGWRDTAWRESSDAALGTIATVVRAINAQPRSGPGDSVTDLSPALIGLGGVVVGAAITQVADAVRWSRQRTIDKRDHRERLVIETVRTSSAAAAKARNMISVLAAAPTSGVKISVDYSGMDAIVADLRRVVNELIVIGPRSVAVAANGALQAVEVVSAETLAHVRGGPPPPLPETFGAIDYALAEVVQAAKQENIAAAS